MKSASFVAHALPPVVFDRLTAAIGIDRGALDPGRLKWILGARCRQLGIADVFAYAAYLDATPAEIDVLIDHVVVQETRFFRDPAVFEYIRAAVTQLAASTDAPLRILSAPCGTGQEAYSLAALLASIGLPPARFAIDAFDISLSALAIAERGVYPEHAMTHVSPELQQACGSRHGKQWHIDEALRRRIRFARRNLAESGALGSEAQYHLILCRNLFIYLRPEARKALAQSLAAALAPGGRLVIGTADRVEELNALFSPLRPAASFAFVRREAAATAPSPKKHAWKGREFPPAVSAPKANGLQPRRESQEPATAADLFQRATEHHQHGDLATAERRCRQALYLAPNFLPALELLQSLWSQNPNLRLRRALRERILRNRPPVSETGWKETA